MQESCIGCEPGPESGGQKGIRERLIASETAAQRVAGELNASDKALFRCGCTYDREVLGYASCTDVVVEHRPGA